MDKYKKDRILGSGTFGTVSLVKSTLSRVSYVLKEIDLSNVSEIDRQRALTEVSVLSKCNHKNIIKYKDSVINNGTGKLSIVMEYAAGGDLYTAIVRQRGIPFAENCVISWFIQICLALQYIHFKNILHRDLKTKNIFLTRNKIIKIGDFGIVKVLKDSEELATTSIGTPYYLSPEICQKRPYNFKSDMWALGCVLFEMSALEHPFKARDFIHLISLIQSGKRKEFPSWCGPVIKELVQELLIYDPAKRPSTDEILASPSLQPYLSRHLLNNDTSETLHFSVEDTRSISTEALKIFQENCSERGASLSTLTPRPGKVRVHAPKAKLLPRTRAYSTSVAVAKSFQTLPSMKTEIKIPRVSKQGISSSRLPDSSKCNSGMNSTFLVCKNSIDDESRVLFSTEIQTAEKYLTPDVDCGYQSQEVILGCSREKENSLSKWSKPSSDLLADKSEKQISSKQADCKINDSVRMYEAASSSTSSFTNSRPNSEDFRHNHCQHGQCHQCMIDMLWKNRIRGCIGVSSLNTNEYCKLKNELLLIFKNDLFQKVYESLVNDWEKIDASSVSIQSFIKNLNYEQMQHLPLMMQLIQLDFLTKSSKDKNASPSGLL